MANRKLQGEIERILKKVSEGSQGFDSIIEKVYNAPSQNQKEKYEGDLKKEIKKLQRYRDQIKTWMTFSDKEVKDKKALMEARRMIEKHMERFKICEKETKTKAYSKEGLQKQTAQKDAKGPLRNWIQQCLETLQEQMKEYQKKLSDYTLSNDPDLLEAIITLEHTTERHEFHIEHLEFILSAWENDTISKQQIKKVQEQVNEYIEQNQDEDYYEDEELYEAAGINITTGNIMTDDLNRVSKEVIADVEASKDEESDAKSVKSSKQSVKTPTPHVEAKPKKTAPKRRPVVIPIAKPVPIVSKSVAKPVVEEPAPSVQSTTKKMKKMQLGEPPNLSSSASHDEDDKNGDTFGSPIGQRMRPGTLQEMASITQNQIPQSQAPSQPQKHLQHIPQQPIQNHNMPKQPPMVHSMPSADGKMNRAEELYILQQSARFMPRDFQPPYKPTYPVQTPSCYPTTPLAVFDTPKLYQKYKVDTLFFIFYYTQRKVLQCLAARELNSRSWRYHTKYLTWFQRHEEPIETTNEYEKGTYIYFDYESGWCQRKKSEFVFEYVYLEDQFYENTEAY